MCYFKKKYSLQLVLARYRITKYEKYRHASALIYYFAYSLCLILIFSQRFDETGIIRTTLDIFRPVGILGLLIFVKYIVFQSHSVLSVMSHICLLSVLLGRMYWGENADITIALAVLLVISSENIDIEIVFRILLIQLSIWLTYASILGAIMGRYITLAYEDKGRISYQVLGWNSNTMGLYLFVIFALLVYCMKGRLTWVRRIVAVIFIVYEYYVVHCLTSVGSILILLMLVELISSEIVSETVKRKVYRITSVLTMLPGIVFFIAPATLDIYKLFKFRGFVFKLTSNRLHSTYDAYQVYPVTSLWGQVFNKDYVLGIRKNAYLDSFLPNSLLEKGLLWTILLLIGIGIVLYKAYRDNNVYLICLIAVYLLYASFEKTVMSFYYCPFWVMVFSESTMKKTTRIDVGDT